MSWIAALRSAHLSPRDAVREIRCTRDWTDVATYITTLGPAQAPAFMAAMAPDDVAALMAFAVSSDALLWPASPMTNHVGMILSHAWPLATPDWQQTVAPHLVTVLERHAHRPTRSVGWSLGVTAVYADARALLEDTNNAAAPAR